MHSTLSITSGWNMSRKIIIDGKQFETHRLGEMDFVYCYVVPDEADGPFCFLDRCGVNYKTDTPRTPEERTATLMWAGNADGAIRFDLGMVSKTSALWWYRRGEIAATARLA